MCYKGALDLDEIRNKVRVVGPWVPFFQGNIFIQCIDDGTFKSFKIHKRIFLNFLRNYTLKCLAIKALIIPV